MHFDAGGFQGRGPCIGSGQPEEGVKRGTKFGYKNGADESRLLIKLCRSQPFQHLRHACTASAKVSGESSSVLELTGVEKRLVVAGEFERIVGFSGNGGTAVSGSMEPFQGITSITAARRNLLNRKVPRSMNPGST
jgi:hypothetical protein